MGTSQQPVIAYRVAHQGEHATGAVVPRGATGHDTGAGILTLADGVAGGLRVVRDKDRNVIGRPRGFQARREERAQADFGFGLQRELFGLDAHKHTADEQPATADRSVWVTAADVDGELQQGATVTALRPLNDWCLRADDGSAPIPAGTALAGD